MMSSQKKCGNCNQMDGRELISSVPHDRYLFCLYLGYGIKANTDWKQTLGGHWRQYEEIIPAVGRSAIGQVAIECRNSKVLLALLKGKVVQAGVIDVASDAVETADDVAGVIEAVAKFVPAGNIVPTTNCGMAPMRRDVAEAKLMALGAGAKLARGRMG
jgi:5-methyltetrahydropteroyltriglutamate--homocysteine methyltransferase